MNFRETQFYRLNHKALVDRTEEIKEEICNGVTLEVYPNVVGYLAGLREAMAIAENIVKQLDQDELP